MTSNDEHERESRRILTRVERESAAGGLLHSAMEDPAKASAQDDWIEYWGTRIGRTVGRVVAVVLVGWIVLYALNLI